MKRLTIALSLLLLFVASAATASPAWHQPTHPLSHFLYTWQHSVQIRKECGLPTGPEHRVRAGYQQKFQRCRMVEGAVKVEPNASSPPPSAPSTQATVPPTLRPTSTPFVPTATPWIPPTVAPTPTPDTSSPVLYELSLMNADRAQYGLPAYTLNATQSAAAQKHSDAEAATGTIWHVNPSYPAQSFPQTIVVPFSSAGENTGEYGPGDVDTALSWIDQAMMAESNQGPGCQGSHRCNILGPSFTQVGIGVTTSGGITYVVVDFVG